MMIKNDCHCGRNAVRSNLLHHHKTLTLLILTHHALKASSYKARGRPRKRWIHDIKEALNKFNMTPVQATQLAIYIKPHIPPL